MYGRVADAEFVAVVNRLKIELSAIASHECGECFQDKRDDVKSSIHDVHRDYFAPVADCACIENICRESVG